MYRATQGKPQNTADEIKGPEPQDDQPTPCTSYEIHDHDPETGEILSLYGKGTPKSSTSRRSKSLMPWHDKNKKYLPDPSNGLRYQISRSLKKEHRDEIDRAGIAAQLLGLPMTMHLTLKPDRTPEKDGRGIRLDDMTPLERMRLWDWIANKIRSHCKARDFPCVYIMVRESDPDTHQGEHAHFLIYVPPKEIERFIRVSEGWCDNAMAKVVDAKERMVDGRVQSVLAYLGKACPQAAFADKALCYRKSGAVAGPRFKITRMIGAKVQMQKGLAHLIDNEIRVRDRIRRERRLVNSIIRNARRDIRDHDAGPDRLMDFDVAQGLDQVRGSGVASAECKEES